MEDGERAQEEGEDHTGYNSVDPGSDLQTNQLSPSPERRGLLATVAVPRGFDLTLQEKYLGEDSDHIRH